MPSCTSLHFSYGANCNSAVLSKRGVIPISSVPAIAGRDFALSFQHRGGYATLTRRDHQESDIVVFGASELHADESVVWQPHGKLYELSSSDLAALSAAETGYTLRPIQVTPYGSLQSEQATAFFTRPPFRLSRPLPPTERYLRLIVDGARSGGIEKQYLDRLSSFQTAPHGGLSAEYFDTPSSGLAAVFVAAVLTSVVALWIGLGH